MSEQHGQDRGAPHGAAPDEPDAPGGPPGESGGSAEPTIAQRFWHELMTGSATLTVLSVLLALVVGGVLIVVSDPRVAEAAGYFLDRPSDTLLAAWQSVSSAYAAMFEGALINFGEYSVPRAVRPIGETLTNATPLIAAGLAVAVAFRAGLLNIGAEGQIILGAVFAGYTGFALDLPVVVHLVVAVAASVVGGAVWGGIAGLLKARTGAHEVIVTIMLNYIARFLLAYLLTTEAFQRAGRSDPVSPYVADSAELPQFFEGSRLHLGFVLAILAAAVVWWLLTHSTFGFRFRAVGFNAHAATTAGISVPRVYTAVMCIAGGLAGFAGAAQVLGTERYLAEGISGGLGFDAITVALLGRANPWGTVAAGLLFGALRSGAVTMQAQTGTPIDIVLVVQSLIVLFVAAPPLVRAIFRLNVRSAGLDAPVARGWGK